MTHMLGGIPHIYADFNCQAALACVDVFYETIKTVCSNHCPIYTSFQCPSIGSPTRPLPKPQPSSRLELPHRNLTILALYREEMDAWTTQHASTSADIDPRTAATLTQSYHGSHNQRHRKADRTPITLQGWLLSPLLRPQSGAADSTRSSAQSLSCPASM